MTDPLSTPQVLAELTAIGAGSRPTRSDWTFDLHLSNPTDGAQWYLVSSPMEDSLATPRRAPGGTLEVISTEAGDVPIVRLQGTPEIVGVLLPGQSTLTLRNLTLSCWLEDGLSELHVWASRELLVSGEPVGSHWFGGAALAAEADEADYRLATRTQKALNPDLESEDITYPSAVRWSVPIDPSAFELPWAEGNGAGPESFGPAPDGP